MHHFRGTLLEGNQTRLDPANVYIDFPQPATGGPVHEWSGYLLVASESDVRRASATRCGWWTVGPAT